MSGLELERARAMRDVCDYLEWWAATESADRPGRAMAIGGALGFVLLAMNELLSPRGDEVLTEVQAWRAQPTPDPWAAP